MEQWKIMGIGKNTIRFTHDRAVYIVDYHQSLNFDLRKTIDPAYLRKALEFMGDTEKGGYVNDSENRMVGHYWLRNPDLAPDKEIKNAITEAVKKCVEFSARVLMGKVVNEEGKPFEYLSVIGIGGSQLGFQCVAKALADRSHRLKYFSFDNTDPDTVDAMINEIGQDDLEKMLFVVCSKSGGTTEIHNLYTVFEQVYKKKGMSFAKHAVAVSMEGSSMYSYAKEQGWLDVFPVWDWVGGRFSVFSPVGILPLALLGLDVKSLLTGAAAMDELTRNPAYLENPALLIAHYILTQSEKEGKHHMVVLPYKDKLDLLGKFLQQLFMESLGKTLATPQGIGHSGLTIFGNKGTTDQHSYVQQLLAGYNDFFTIFISVLEEKSLVAEYPVEGGDITMGDYLLAFCHGTQNAMKARRRESMAITLDRLDAFTLGSLIALFERIVGYLAVYMGINPYDQPQVEEGKRSASAIIEVRKKLNDLIAASNDGFLDAGDLKKAFAPEEYHVLYYLLLSSAKKGKVKANEKEWDQLLIDG